VVVEILIYGLTNHLAHTPAIDKISFCFGDVLKCLILIFIDVKRLPLSDRAFHLGNEGYPSGYGTPDGTGNGRRDGLLFTECLSSFMRPERHAAAGPRSSGRDDAAGAGCQTD
jgi:hypothetical protein